MRGSTEFLKRKHPLLKALLDYAFSKIETIVLAAIVGGLFSFNSCRHQHLAAQVQRQGTTLTNVVEYIAP